jgi:D-alanyl-D-alanine dipeptidase
MPARTLLIALTVVLAGSLCASASAADLVDVRRYASSIQVEVRYATANNFTGARPGAEGLRRLPSGARLAGDGALGAANRQWRAPARRLYRAEEQPQPRKHGRQLDVGTAFDAFTPRANTTRARGRVLGNRLILKNAMEDQSFVNYFREWWHFDSEEPATRRLDVPIDC